MADFTTGMTDTTQLDDNAVLAFSQSFIIANSQSQVLDENVVQMKEEFGAKSFSFPRFDVLTPTSTPLTEKEDPDSDSMTDSDITVTPQEFGKVITTTKLSNLQSGGRTDVAAAQLVGRNAGESQDSRAISVMDGGTKLTIDGTALASITASQVADDDFLETAYNKLARASVPAVGDMYVWVAHDDVISDIRADVSSGSWVDVNKYGSGETVLRNEVGSYKGFRVLRHNNATINADAGSGTVDVYNSYFMGFNALGKGTSNPVGLTITGPFDKLGRFLNIGWYGVYDYVRVESEALYVGQCASSKGSN